MFPKQFEILYVEKEERFNPHEAIKRVGGKDSYSMTWAATRDQVIVAIESGRYEFFVSSGNYYSIKARVIVAVNQFGHKYIKTEPDNTKQDNLLSLPSFPSVSTVTLNPFNSF